VKRTAVLLAALLLAGCGSSPAQQAEDLQSLAAEGSLLAHDAGEGDEWGPYREAHAQELAEQASSLESQAKTRRISAFARVLARDLQALAGADTVGARRLEDRLNRLAGLAERLP
jgi:hypothetical protein